MGKEEKKPKPGAKGGKGPKKKIKLKDTEPDLSKEIGGVIRTGKAWLYTFALALASFLLIAAFSATRLSRDIELKTVDFRFRLRPQITVRDDIVMIDIDNESLRKYGRWPWPRTRIARVVNGLTRFQADRVLLDIEFVDPSQMTVKSGNTRESVQQEVETVRRSLTETVDAALTLFAQGYGKGDIAPTLLAEGGAIDERFQTLGRLFDGITEDPDAVLAESLKKPGNVFLVFHLRDPRTRPADRDPLDKKIEDRLKQNLDLKADMIAAELSADPEQVEQRIPRLRAVIITEEVRNQIRAAGETAEIEDISAVTMSALPTNEPYRFQDVVNQLVPWEYSRFKMFQWFGMQSAKLGSPDMVGTSGGLIPLVPVLADSARGAGFSNANPDQDGTFRRLPPFLADGDRVFIHASFLLALDQLGVDPDTVSLDNQTIRVPLPTGKDLNIPLEKDGQYFINYAGAWNTFKHLSAQSFLTIQDMEQWQWELLRKAADRYLGGQFDELVGKPFTPELLGQVADSVLPQIKGMIDRLEQQVETSPRFKDNPDLMKRVTARLDLMDSVISAYDQMEQEKTSIIKELENTVAGSTCIVVLTASGTADIGVMPFMETYPMGETYANVVNACTNGDFITELPIAYTSLVALGLTFILAGILPFLGYWAGMAVALLLIGAHLAVSFLLFTKSGLILGVVSPVITIALAFIVISVYHRVLTFKAFLMYRREKATLEKDIELAKRIQARLLPAEYPKVEGLDIAGRSRPARGLAGDFYTFFEQGEKKLSAAIADITGKGVAAALLANMIRSAMKTVIATSGDSPQLMEQVNIIVSREQIIKESSFATCMYLTIDLEEMKVSFFNAGHNPIIVAREGEEKCLEFFVRGVPVGVMKKMKFKRVEEDLKPGDVLFLFTDGINEAHNSKDEMYGMDRMNEMILKSRHLSADEIITAVFDDVDKFAGKRKQFDDMTATVFKIADTVPVPAAKENAEETPDTPE